MGRRSDNPFGLVGSIFLLAFGILSWIAVMLFQMLRLLYKLGVYINKEYIKNEEAKAKRRNFMLAVKKNTASLIESLKTTGLSLSKLKNRAFFDDMKAERKEREAMLEGKNPNSAAGRIYKSELKKAEKEESDFLREYKVQKEKVLAKIRELKSGINTDGEWDMIEAMETKLVEAEGETDRAKMESYYEEFNRFTNSN